MHVRLNIFSANSFVIVKQTYNSRIVFQALELLTVSQLRNLFLVVRLRIYL